MSAVRCCQLVTDGFAQTWTIVETCAGPLPRKLSWRKTLKQVELASKPFDRKKGSDLTPRSEAALFKKLLLFSACKRLRVEILI